MAANVDNVAHGWVEASATTIASAAQTHTAGATLVAFIRHEGAATSITVADTAGNTWTPGTYRSHANGDLNGQFFYVENCAGNASNVVTATLGAARAWRGISVYQISGLATSSSFVDEDFGQATASTSATAGSTTVSPGIILVGPSQYATVSTWGLSAGYTLDKNSVSTNATQTTGLGYKVISAGGSEAPQITSGSSNDQFILTLALSEPQGTIDQEGFRFRNDDGSETTATWAASQDTNHTAPLATNLRLRTLINATNDPAAIAYTLRYQKNGTGGYVAVPVGASSDIAPVIETADATESGDNNTTPTSPWPVSTPALSTGDLIVMILAWDDSTNNTGVSVANGPNGETWSQISGVVASASTEVRLTAYYTKATGSWSAGSINVTPNANEQWTASVLKIPAGEFDSTTPIGAANTLASAGTAESTVNSPSLTAGSSDGGGRVIWAAAADADPQSSLSSGYTAITNTDRGQVSLSVQSRDTASSDSESISAAQGTITIASDSWCSIIFIVRGITVTNEVYVSASSNITAGGEASTAQLTAPSGKTTSDFTTGRMWDDENGTDTIDIASDFYTELEWCLKAQSPAVDTDYFDFRVYKGSTAADTYTVTPRWTIGTGGGAYSLAMGQGTYSVTGQAVAMKAARQLAAAQGSYALTGQAVALVHGYPLVAAQGSYSLSGQAAALRAARTLGAGQGSYALTGQDVSLNYSPIAKTIQIGQGTYAVTGQTVALRAARNVAAGQGSYALTGQAVGLKFGRVLAAGQGTYTFTGSNALADFAITMSPGTYTLTGQAVGLVAARRLAAAQGSYAMTGQSAGLKRGFPLVAAQGSYLIAGQDVALTYSAAGGRTMAVGQGSYSLSGQSLALRIARSLAAAAGTLVLTGQAVALSGARRLALAQGAYTLTGQDLSLARTRVLTAAQGLYALSGQQVGVLSARRITIGNGSYSLTGSAAGLHPSRRLAAGQGSYSITGGAAAIRSARRLALTAGAYSLAGQAVAFNYSGALTPISEARTYVVRGENRVLLVQAESRTYNVRAESREWRIPR